MSTITRFMETHFRHFNARETLDAAKGWRDLLDRGGKMFLTMAGAMSTAEIGVSLAEMIRKDKVHAISCTAANLEEDLFNLFNHNEYKMVPHYRDLSPEMEKELYDQGFNRVTDTCIPEGVLRQVQRQIAELWKRAADTNSPKFPYEFMYDLLDQPGIQDHFQVPAEHSWVLAAKEKGLTIYSPGFEDSTLGNIFCSEVISGRVKNHGAVRHGTEQMQKLAEWYTAMGKAGTPIGFFQIGGGIAADFPICVVPMLIQDLEHEDTPFWAYFAQIGDSTTSYGSYSGAVPNEKITWGKLDVGTPSFMINSDAAIVAPLIFAYVLGM
ncbi:deoxyhypusine synthase family protein [Desulfovibrio sulfodismutans]|uniref:Deoxyhypusine synthase family protein n=1 Tax=Desulfolutivibrio sulfodismutans TaxID=63561 RepID=A0A7K3NR63_9BACT|nr:deoxyhypusine synthase family protein [Desulfolutivibrio sulfodismutans]NDY58702.1 deoxyhypusine synthase family protein [Desulfolutivibrio sulfodismutans]QLA12098.1 deoxyhypusine synthase [Desulfolutivibrio sulfodismutans DSM 3696]